jgi:hypothetical protein
LPSDIGRLTGKIDLSLSMNLEIRFSCLRVNPKACRFATPGASAHCLRSAELRFGKVRRESPVRADSEIGAPLSAMLHGAMSRACCPNGMERGCPTRSDPDCQMSARNSTGLGVVERAAAETPIDREQAAALRCLQNDSGNTLSKCALNRSAMVFSLAAQPGIFYSGFTAVTEPVKAPDESSLACARRGAAVSDRIDLTQIESVEKL